MKVFVCDDDRDILEFMRILLKESGYEVYATEECGVGIIRNIVEYRPDVMVFDYWLNGTKSDKIISKIRKNDSLKETPIILISAVADLDKVAQKIPIDDYMKKPFDIKDLLYKIKNMANYA